MKYEDVQTVRDQIIIAALGDVAFDGWSMETIRAATERVGHSAGEVAAVFPRGMRDAQDALSDLADRKMLEALEGVDAQALRVRDRVKAALMARFEWLDPYKEAVRQSLQYTLIPAVPFRKPAAAGHVWRTADCIWEWAGDTATDYNRYTKRGLLSGIIVSATLFWLNDDERALEGFVERRIEDVMRIGKLTGKVKGFGARFKKTV